MNFAAAGMPPFLSHVTKFLSQISTLEKVTAYLEEAEASNSVVSATPLWV
jgi:hypothetical protein